MDGRRITIAIKLAVLIGFFFAAGYGFRFSSAGRAITAENILHALRNLDPLVAKLAYVGFYVVGTVLLLPGVVMSFAGGLLFGVWQGSLLTWIGATLGALASFGVSRWLGRGFVEGLLGGRFTQFDAWIGQRGFHGLLLIRLLPIFPFNGVNFGCGLTGISFKDYLIATAIGIVPGTFVYQYLFATLGESALTAGLSWGILGHRDVLIPLGIFMAFMMISRRLARRFFPKN